LDILSPNKKIFNFLPSQRFSSYESGESLSKSLEFVSSSSSLLPLLEDDGSTPVVSEVDDDNEIFFSSFS
jgi:hypothetical protein